MTQSLTPTAGGVWAKLDEEDRERRLVLSVAALAEIAERTKLHPEDVFAALSTDDEDGDDEDELSLADHIVAVSKSTSKNAQQVAEVVIEAALVCAGTPRETAQDLVHRFVRRDALGRLAGKWTTLAGKVLAACFSAPENEQFPPKLIKAGETTEDDKFTFASFWQAAGAIGIAPSEIRSMSPWELAHYRKGWAVANGAEEQGSTAEELEQLRRMVEPAGDLDAGTQSGAS